MLSERKGLLSETKGSCQLSCPRRRAGGRCPWGRPTSSSRAMSTSKGRPKAFHRQVRPASPPFSAPHYRERLDAQPDREALAPATVLTLPRTPRACPGRFPGSSWGQTTPLGARCWCPPLGGRQLPRDASARSRRPPQVFAVLLSKSARTAALLWHPKHPWEGVPPSVYDLSGSVRRERANCHMCHMYKA